ncbi:hypothetical protein EXN66_Car006157 [Channa argus]|uniref:Uncharacterized protein n=1 Tax=Channa argus TaxID=215402 RepID=A0A6G1PK21_CHAAH|nr:hypothetical protein EXN66_Car006157 [Channa argus]
MIFGLLFLWLPIQGFNSPSMHVDEGLRVGVFFLFCPSQLSSAQRAGISYTDFLLARP